MEFYLFFVLLIILCLCTFIDISKKIIPNYLVVLILALGLINGIIHNSLYTVFSGVFIPSLILIILKYKINLCYIGAGDIKLLSAIGSWVGWFLNIYIFLSACVIALLFSLFCILFFNKSLKSVPFTPFLFASTLSLYYLYFINIY
ncbi:MAG: prepilin peptidase [Eubacteriales bacterium]